MTKYLLPCPKCNAEMPIDVGQAGQTIPCGECQVEVEVPTMRGIRSLKTVEGSGSTTAAPSWSRRQGILFATGLPLMIVALALATYFLFLRSKIDTSRPEDITRASEEAYIDKLGAEDIWDAWLTARDTQLQRYDIPQHEKNRRQARKLLILAIASVAVAGLGLGVVIAAFVVKPSADASIDAQQPPR